MRRLSLALYVIGFILFAGTFLCAVYFSVKMNDGQTNVSRVGDIPTYRYHFVLVPEEIDNDYWRLVDQGAQAAAKEHHVLLEYIGPKQGNIEEHLKTLEMAAAAKVDGIITQSLNEQQFTPLINELVEQGTPVITIDTDAEQSKRNSYIGTNNYYSGFLAGKKLLADMEGEVNVAIITGNFHSSNQQLRVNGFQDFIKNEPRVKVVAIEESAISLIRASEKANQILTKYPEVNAFYGTSALDGIGIAEAVKRLDRDDLYIIGFDTLKETLTFIQDGTIDATVAQQPYQMGYDSVQLMVDLMEGKSVSELNYTDTFIVTKEDVHHLMGDSGESVHD